MSSEHAAAASPPMPAGEGGGAEASKTPTKKKRKSGHKRKDQNGKKKAKNVGVDAGLRRIQKELAEISADPPACCSAGPKGENLREWVRSTCQRRQPRPLTHPA